MPRWPSLAISLENWTWRSINGQDHWIGRQSRLKEKFTKKPSKWKASLLSIGGRFTLIKSVLDFFWGGASEKRKMAWVRWDQALASHEKGGLNIGSLKAFNLALLQKWRWRFTTNPNLLWVKLIKAIHGFEAGFDGKGSATSGIWSIIVGSTNYLHSRNFLPKDILKCHPGNGNKIRFLKDHWIGDEPLCSKYNRADYQEFKGGSVAFGGNNVRITSKGKIKIGRLKGIKREYSNSKTPQQNEVAERKNRTLIEAPRTMLADLFLPTTFWAEAINTACYDLNRPIWSAYSTTVKSSGDKIKKNTGFKTCEKLVSQVEQVFLEELKKLKRQENEANDATELLRMEATNDIQSASTSSTNLINTTSTPLSTASPSRAFNDGEHSYLDPSKYAFQYDPLMPHLEDIYASPSDGIFTDSSYDDEGVVTDFNNLETTKVWILVNLCFGKKAIRTKWVYRNKKDEIDVKSAFLYGTIDEELYVSQPPGFVGLKFSNKVNKVVKALYGLHQAPKAWYATLSTFMEKSRYRRRAVDKTLFIKMDKKDIMLVQVYVDDIIFGSTKSLGVTLKTSHLHAVKRIFRYLKGQPKLGNPQQKVVNFLAGDLSYSTAKSRLLWNQLLDDGFNFMNTKIYIDNERTICIVKNPVFHSKTKHIEIRHHFIRDAYVKMLIQVLKIHTDDNVDDLRTKAFDVSSKELASLKQKALGKDISNLLMAGRLPKTTLPTSHGLYKNVDPHEFTHV
nr:retrovirus-related Pol polyprotein from transposon TNT 1-94 [Tanacetum cinerariifolium]